MNPIEGLLAKWKRRCVGSQRETLTCQAIGCSACAGGAKARKRQISEYDVAARQCGQRERRPTRSRPYLQQAKTRCEREACYRLLNLLTGVAQLVPP